MRTEEIIRNDSGRVLYEVTRRNDGGWDAWSLWPYGGRALVAACRTRLEAIDEVVSTHEWLTNYLKGRES
jgi:hypothetical protein